jgi:hypothetical protein
MLPTHSGPTRQSSSVKAINGARVAFKPTLRDAESPRVLLVTQRRRASAPTSRCAALIDDHQLEVAVRRGENRAGAGHDVLRPVASRN